MGKYVKGNYIYSMNDCACAWCMHYDSDLRKCLLTECCCRAEKREARRHFPPYGFERRKEVDDALDREGAA